MQTSITFWLLILAVFAVLLYVMVMPRVSGGDGARLSAAHADIAGGIKTAINNYKADNGFYPKSFNDLLKRTDEAKGWHGPYLEQLPVDPWGGIYVYAFPGTHNPASYDLLSAGPDGKQGTDDDIGNWMTQ